MYIVQCTYVEYFLEPFRNIKMHIKDTKVVILSKKKRDKITSRFF